MQLGIRIITSAFQNKMHSLEQEIRGLRLTCEEQRTTVTALQKKNSALEVELVESHQRSQQLGEENKELFKTVNSLRKQIARLEHLKAAVLSSIQDDQVQEAELGDTRLLMSEEFLKGATPLTAAEMGYGAPPLPRPVTMAPAAASMPPREAIAARPTPAHFDSQLASPSGPMSPAGASGVQDGKKFFKDARNRLSFEAFNQFLASIKRLNNNQQTREETLEETKRIFGPGLEDLYLSFETLLNRHSM